MLKRRWSGRQCRARRVMAFLQRLGPSQDACNKERLHNMVVVVAVIAVAVVVVVVAVALVAH